MAKGKGQTPARLKLRYQEEILPQLVKRFGYTSPMQAPKLRKITLNMGVGEAKQNTSLLDNAGEQLATIAGQKPQVRRARKSIANFKLREGMPVGVRVTLRGDRMYELLDRLMSIALPRVRDFRGLNPRSFDGRGNYSLGVKEQLIFPEIDYDSIDAVRGLDVTITTTAATDEEAFELLAAFGMPFRKGWRPGAAAEPELDPEEQRRIEEARQRQEAEAAAREALRAEQPVKEEEGAEGEGAEGEAQPGEGGSEQSTPA